MPLALPEEGGVGEHVVQGTFSQHVAPCSGDMFAVPLSPATPHMSTQGVFMPCQGRTCFKTWWGNVSAQIHAKHRDSRS